MQPPLSGRLVLLSALALLVSLFAIITSANAQSNPAPGYEPLREATLSITGIGRVTAEPDIAVVGAGVVTEGQTARIALDANSKIMADAFAALQAAGIEARDMQTSSLRVEPRYTYFEPQNGVRRAPRIDGYQVTNQLTVRIRDLATIGEALDALIEAGVNQLGGLSFAVDEPEAQLNEARRQAVADAIAQAELLTEAAGVGLGRIISIQPSGGMQPPPQPMMARAMFAEAADSVPIATGEQELSVSVTITWALEAAGR